MEKNKIRVKIEKDGPYIVSGNVPLSEKKIKQVGKGYEYEDGRELPQTEEYLLCRCGKSQTPPFCDGAHKEMDFDGTETATKDKFIDRAQLIQGPDLDLLDDHRCAFARFCHTEAGSAWELVKKSDNPKDKEMAIKAASECPAGRLVAAEKTGKAIEPEYEPGIEIIQDPEKNVSCGIFLKGGIPIESSNGDLYEVRNRVMLCRCGKSKNKPFCDATHVKIKFKDDQ